MNVAAEHNNYALAKHTNHMCFGPHVKTVTPKKQYIHYLPYMGTFIYQSSKMKKKNGAKNYM
jgi:hypothetical protein